ncbi:hypothetical protein MtrunA17_Chr7g0267191 [Medicago truncatula]|nr:uncharacterized protein LOC25499461 [Medicago truncatula]XP_024625533.1 uncharacterized protein LOC25499461 [Medicago truncatula]XP_039683188.1 uncharacterized protein LOC25499461 [Medicago truncatula]XP_039683189.1 uncharacterized protein LOC25499461 [Medicago truncatula]RHN48759.1 hypothetical protein MtrunA17_Chr7g0267191 [Medicago truncatula]
MDPNSVRPVKHLIVNVEDEDDESGGEDMNHYESGKDVYAEYNRYDPRIKDLLNNDSAFWPDFMEGSSGQVPTQGVRATQVSSQGDEATQVPARRVEVNQVLSQGNGTKKTAFTPKVAKKIVKEKRKGRQSGGATKLSNQIDALISNTSTAVELLNSDDSSGKHDNANSTVAAAITVINRMVVENNLEKGSALWCFAPTLIENEVRRDIFMNIEDDDGRKSWLMYMQANQK